MPDEFFGDISNEQTPPVYNYFDGSSWRKSESGKTTVIHSPIGGEAVGELQVVTTKEIDQVIESASTAQQKWEATPLHERIKVMHLTADWIRHFEDYLVSLMIREIAKSQGEAKSEISRTADLIDYFANEAQSIKGEELDSDNFPGFDKGRIALIERVAYGVVLAIAPFNYPVNLSASKLAPALLMGNSVIFKPPTMGGISALHLVRIFQKAGLPEGVLSAVTGGGGHIGNYLVGHDKISLITFTGSSDTGVAIAHQAGMKTLVFECGGNNPALVMPDADMHLTAKEIVKGAFSYAGQRCTAIKYVLATQTVIDALLPQVQKQMEELVHMGDPRSPQTKLVGPVISVSEAVKIEQAINEAIAEGARVVTGGKRNGAYIEPTVLTNVQPNWTICTCEVFGPILSFIPIQSIDESIRAVNASRFGLQASVFSKDEGSALVIAKKLNVGTVQINGSPQRGPDHFPFLGVKKSGLGVQGVKYSLESMSRLRPIVLNKPA